MLAVRVPILPISIADSATCWFLSIPIESHLSPPFPTPDVGVSVGKNIADSALNVGKSKGQKKPYAKATYGKEDQCTYKARKIR